MCLFIWISKEYLHKIVTVYFFFFFVPVIRNKVSYRVYGNL